jgi:regulatory protein
MADPRGSRRLRPPTPERLRNRALAYLRRFATTEAHLGGVLLRRARPEAAAHGIEEADLVAMILPLVRRLAEAGAIDDAAFARARARRLTGEGNAPGRIRDKLRQKGLAGEAVATAIDEVGQEVGDVELAAAIAFARRRRLGPWRRGGMTPEKELATFARAGFGYRVAQQVIRAADADELAAALAETTT